MISRAVPVSGTRRQATAEASRDTGERAVTDGLSGQDAEQVEARGFLRREDLELVTAAASGVEDLESLRGLDQAHRAVDHVADGVRVGRDTREGGQVRE